VPVTTGITGATDIEVTAGIQPGQTLVTGRYKTLRILKSGTVVKPDNTAEVETTS
jgi:HlyD family secretion protein